MLVRLDAEPHYRVHGGRNQPNLSATRRLGSDIPAPPRQVPPGVHLSAAPSSIIRNRPVRQSRLRRISAIAPSPISFVMPECGEKKGDILLFDCSAQKVECPLLEGPLFPRPFRYDEQPSTMRVPGR